MSGSLNLSEIIAEHRDREGPLLPILHDVQEAFGCVDAGAEAEIARALNLSRAEVHGVGSLPRFHARGRPASASADMPAEACQSRGVEALMPAAQAAAGERVRLKTVYWFSRPRSNA